MAVGTIQREGVRVKVMKVGWPVCMREWLGVMVFHCVCSEMAM